MKHRRKTRIVYVINKKFSYELKVEENWKFQWKLFANLKRTGKAFRWDQILHFQIPDKVKACHSSSPPFHCSSQQLQACPPPLLLSFQSNPISLVSPSLVSFPSAALAAFHHYNKYFLQDGERGIVKSFNICFSFDSKFMRSKSSGKLKTSRAENWNYSSRYSADFPAFKSLHFFFLA